MFVSIILSLSISVILITLIFIISNVIIMYTCGSRFHVWTLLQLKIITKNPWIGTFHEELEGIVRDYVWIIIIYIYGLCMV